VNHSVRMSFISSVVGFAVILPSAVALADTPPTGHDHPTDITMVGHPEQFRRIDTIEPSDIVETQQGTITRITLRGHGFEPGMGVRVGSRTVDRDSIQITSTELSFATPALLVAGTYTLRLEWLDGTTICGRWPLVVRERSCRLKDIPFRKGAVDLDAAGDGATTENIACLARNDGREIVLLGFASREGGKTPNLNLSKHRAEAVAARIATYLPQVTIQSVGLGDALPLRIGETEDDLAENRRVVVVSGKNAPCQGLRVWLDADGSLAVPSAAFVDGQARCFVERGITSALLVLPELLPNDKGTTRLAETLLLLVNNAIEHNGGNPAAIAVKPVYGAANERASLGRIFRMGSIPRNSNFAEIYPMSWFTTSSRFTSIEPIDPTCRYEVPIAAQLVTTGGEVHYDSAHIPPAPRVELPPKDAFIQFRFGTMRALDQTHVGGVARIGRTVFHASSKTGIFIGASLGLFAGGHSYLIAEDLTSNFLIRLNAGAGVFYRAGDFRFEGAIMPGLLLPAAAAFLGDVETSAAWKISDGVEIVGTFGGGLSLWQGADLGGHWFSELGAGWWF
jgi:OmpA family